MNDNNVNNAKSTLKNGHVALDIEDVIEDSNPNKGVSWVKNERQSGQGLTAQGKSLYRSADAYDNNLLHQAVADGGRWAYGVIAAEVWVLNDELTQLCRPESGWWIDPVFHSDCGNNCKVCQLTNPDCEGYLKPEPLFPGEGLPGVLWSDSRRVNRVNASGRDPKSTVIGSLLIGSLLTKSKPARKNNPAKGPIDTTASVDTIAWREIKAIADDPDQPWNPRLQLYGEIGLGWAAAVPFNCHGQKGIVIYMAREHVHMSRLRSSSNEQYLKAASSLIGAAYALRKPRLEMQNESKEQVANLMRRVRRKMLELHRSGLNFADLVEENQETERSEGFSPITESKKHCKTGIEFAVKRITAVAIKSKGGGLQPPPAASWEQSAFTFVGSFITILMICRLNVYLFDVHGSDFTIVLGYVHAYVLPFAFARSTNMISFLSPFLFPPDSPVGALVTLLYGLTAAPASQPRSAIAGQIVSITISLAISYAGDNMSIWMKQALATSLAVAAMAKMGVIHPPAGAEALLFSSGDFGWGNMLFVLVANVIAIGAATVINNFSDYRQYPTFWSFQYTINSIKEYSYSFGRAKAD
jgi:hypothetical protein